MRSRWRGRGVAAAVAIGALSAGLVASAGAGADDQATVKAGSGKGGVKLSSIGSFSEPVYATGAPGRKNRKLLFVVEKAGTVRVVRKGKTLSKPFISIGNRVSREGERGLLSIAFDPGYAKNGRFYLYFTGKNGDIRVAQGRRSGKRNVVARSGLRRVIQIPHREFSNHNGGTVAFGPDGNLWLGTGDGGSGCNPSGSAQSLNSLLGKLLRITPKAKGGYSIPSGNPFVGRPGRDEIYAYGLRNPFRFSFDRAGNTITIGDVGQGELEEIDHETLGSARGANFGWAVREGLAPANCGAPPSGGPFERPIFQYRHSGRGFTGCSIIGGLIVRDQRLKSLRGRYLYTDLCNGQLRSLVPQPNGAKGDRALGPEVNSAAAISQGRGKKVYVSSVRTGDVSRIDPARR